METSDPALTKTRIKDSTLNSHDDIDGNTTMEKGTETFQESVIGTDYVNDDNIHGNNVNGDYSNKQDVTRDDIEDYTTVNEGTETFQETIVGSEHVNPGDNAARQPDRRDQKGSPFDDGINERNVGSEAPKSEGLTDMNRYANIDNAQTRVLNPDEKD